MFKTKYRKNVCEFEEGKDFLGHGKCEPQQKRIAKSRVDFFGIKHSAFRRQATDKEKIYAVNITDSGVVSRKYKELL